MNTFGFDLDGFDDGCICVASDPQDICWVWGCLACAATGDEPSASAALRQPSPRHAPEPAQRHCAASLANGSPGKYRLTIDSLLFWTVQP